jgi:hypothetical protein
MIARLVVAMSSRRTSSVPKEDVFPRMLYCDSSCSQTLPGLSPALPGALLGNATRHLGDGKRVILRQRVRGSVRAVRAVRNTRVFQTDTRVVADNRRSIAAHYLVRAGRILLTLLRIKVANNSFITVAIKHPSNCPGRKTKNH